MNRRPFAVFIILLAGFALLAGSTALAQEISSADATQSTAGYIPGEPNDTLPTATPLHALYLGAEDSPISDWSFLATVADVDIYSVQTPIAAKLRATVTVNHPDEAALRVSLRLLDTAGSQLAQDSSCGLNYRDLAQVETAVPAGTYYLSVATCAGAFDPDMAYQVNARVLVEADAEPNDSRATAGLLQPAAWDDGVLSIDPAGDTDFYRLDMVRGQGVSVEVREWYGVFSPALVVESADGTILQTSTGSKYCYTDNCASVYFIAPADGTYYFRVRSAAHPSGGGKYKIQLDREPVPSDVEPNNTPATATPAGLGDPLGWKYQFGDGASVGTADPVDYYTFYGKAADVVMARCNQFWWGFGCQGASVELFDPAMNPVALNTYFTAKLPATGMYTVKVSYVDDGPPGEQNYGLILQWREPDEPNDSFAQATPITMGVRHEAAFGLPYPYDVDFYRFEARAGDLIRLPYFGGLTELYDSDKQLLTRAARIDHTTNTVYIAPADGTYYLKIADDDDGSADPYGGGPTTVTVVRSGLFVSSDFDNFDGNPTHKEEDIVTRDPATGNWVLVFDASDVGIKMDVTAFDFMPNGSILMSLVAAQTVPGLGKVMPQDIICFVPSSLGENTAGTFEWYLDGSDVGLTTSGEKIDTLVVKTDPYTPYPVVFVSTFGPASVLRTDGSKLAVADEDLIAFVPTQLGANTKGAWRMEWDGSNVPGMKGENLYAAALMQRLGNKQDGQLALGFRDSFKFGSVRGTFKDVAHGVYSKYAPESVPDLAFTNLITKRIDGLSAGPGLNP